jgi:hypothetical protein
LDFLGDVGGLLDLCKIIIGIFITWIAEAKLLNIMSRQMFVLPTKNKKEDLTFDYGKPMFAKKCFAFWYLFCKCGCCCRSREFKEQQKFIDKAGDEVDRQTDLLKLIK